ncbi:unnamed protein product [Medioppia subpectinata]|uniref:Uncharacterized protein n=1 Tax=Medioppia subpectinata TaxID=1979941 RepID=A0A7R9QMM8_9ACAR|nr:unnamed protein product [Medioppia subpectinata]CAG2123481.1 unnamed protein product [Medioppia subpectinata]
MSKIIALTAIVIKSPKIQAKPILTTPPMKTLKIATKAKIRLKTTLQLRARPPL